MALQLNLFSPHFPDKKRIFFQWRLTWRQVLLDSVAFNCFVSPPHCKKETTATFFTNKKRQWKSCRLVSAVPFCLISFPFRHAPTAFNYPIYLNWVFFNFFTTSSISNKQVSYLFIWTWYFSFLCIFWYSMKWLKLYSLGSFSHVTCWPGYTCFTPIF
jgi:hypothetical protein